VPEYQCLEHLGLLFFLDLVQPPTARIFQILVQIRVIWEIPFGSPVVENRFAQATHAEVGIADIVVSVSEILDIDFQGIGSINYIGDPDVNEDVNLLVQIEKTD